jgi:hypothetical protein
MGFLDSIFDPGKKARRSASEAAQQARWDQFGGYDQMYGGGSYNDGQSTFRPGQLQNMFSPMVTGAMQDAFNSDYGMGDLRGSYNDALGGMEGFEFSGGDREMMDKLRGDAMGLFDTLGQSAQELGAGQLDIARQIAAPGEQKARVANQQNLFSQGRMGTTGGAGQTQALAEAQNMADLQRQSMAFNQGQAVRGQALQQLGQNLGSMEQLTQGAYGREMGQVGFNNQMAMDQFGMAGNIFDRGMQASMMPWQQMGAGMNMMQGMQQMQMAPWELAMNARISQANTDIGAAGALSNVATAAGPPLWGPLISGATQGYTAKHSDARLKKNVKRIGTIQDGLGWYEWDWNDKAEAIGVDDEPTFGVIAQEVAEVMPHAVGQRDGYLTVDYSLIGGR